MDKNINWKSETLIKARARMFYPSLSCVVNQHMDKIFETRAVAAGQNVRQLPEQALNIEGDYTIGDDVMSLEAALEGLQTNALIVLKGGKIAFETYRNGSSEETRFLTYSLAKSYVATLIGLLLEDGLIDSISDKVTKYLPELEKSGYAQATIDNVLRMRSGVKWSEIFQVNPDSQLTEVHNNTLVEYNYSWIDYAIEKSEPGEHAPDEKFNYCSLDTAVLGALIEKVSGKTGAQYMAQRLWAPMGAQSDGYWIMDGPEGQGREFFGAGFAATMRDHARFGQLILQGGAWDEKQIIPAQWVTDMTTSEGKYSSISKAMPFGYGYHWWTLPNTQICAAHGLHNQYLYIDKTREIVIVKASYTPEPAGRTSKMYALFEQIAAKAMA